LSDHRAGRTAAGHNLLEALPVSIVEPIVDEGIVAD